MDVRRPPPKPHAKAAAARAKTKALWAAAFGEAVDDDDATGGTARPSGCRASPVALPFEPYPQQAAVVRLVFGCLRRGERVAAVELPTGCGKTAALLAASLAAQARIAALGFRDFPKARDAVLRPYPTMGGASVAGAHSLGENESDTVAAPADTGGDGGGEDGGGSDDDDDPEWRVPAAFYKLFPQAKQLAGGTTAGRGLSAFRPAVLYATRTHPQIRQAAAELGRLSWAGGVGGVLATPTANAAATAAGECDDYGDDIPFAAKFGDAAGDGDASSDATPARAPVSMAIVASRARYCIHPAVNPELAAQAATKHGGGGRRPQQHHKRERDGASAAAAAGDANAGGGRAAMSAAAMAAAGEHGNAMGEMCDKLVLMNRCPMVAGWPALRDAVLRNTPSVGRVTGPPLGATPHAVADGGAAMRAGGAAATPAVESYAVRWGGAAARAWDIEDLVAAGRTGAATHGVPACPYYAARDLLLHANVSFLPYQYIFDPVMIRKETKLEAALRGAILIVDEAHNIADVCQEALSIELDAATLRRTAAEDVAPLSNRPVGPVAASVGGGCDGEEDAGVASDGDRNCAVGSDGGGNGSGVWPATPATVAVGPPATFPATPIDGSASTASLGGAHASPSFDDGALLTYPRTFKLTHCRG